MRQKRESNYLTPISHPMHSGTLDPPAGHQGVLTPEVKQKKGGGDPRPIIPWSSFKSHQRELWSTFRYNKKLMRVNQSQAFEIILAIRIF